MSTIDRSKTAAPLLVAGQRLKQAEFHCRYEAMPPGTRAELIGGVVYMPSPVGRHHGRVSAHVATWLNLYRSRTPGVEVCNNTSTALDDLGEPQPDALLRIAPECGGQTHNAGNLIGGAPELVIEVADTSRNIDLGSKLSDYQGAGVLEYVVVASDPDEVIWHVRRADRFLRVPPDADGVYRS
jgi:Uma2 family endonuclease